MEALGYLPEPPLFMSASQPAAESASQPMLRETMVIRVNGKPQVIYKDEIEKQLYRGLYEHLGFQCGA
jgi:hypothetical protein